MSGSARSPADLHAEEIASRIDDMPFGRFHAKMLAIVGGAHLFDAYDATALAFILPVLLTTWRLTPAEVGYLLASGYAGQFVGAIAGGAIAGRFGRRTALCIALVLLAALSGACALAGGYVVLFLLRMVQGLGLGGEAPVAATYISEMSPGRTRGRMVSAIQWMFAIGTIVSALAAPLLVPRFGWQAMFVLGTAPLLLAGAMRWLLPESAVWLAARGRSRDAEQSLAKIGAPPPPENSRLLPSPPVDSASVATVGWSELFAPGQQRATVSAWLIAFCAAFVGYGINGWMPTLYRLVYHLPVEHALRYGVSNGIAAFFGGFIGLAFIDRFSRRAYMTFGFAGCALMLGALGVLGAGATPLAAAILSGTGYMLLGMPLAGIYVYAPEIYPARIRALGTGVASACLRFASIIGPPLVGYILTYWSVRQLFLVFAAVATVGAIGTFTLAVERRSRIA